jgi:hypothetical protein
MKFTVHSIQPIVQEVPAKTEDGLDVSGNLPGFEVELLPVEPGKTVTLQITAANWSGIDPQLMFALGNTVELGFTLLPA